MYFDPAYRSVATPNVAIFSYADDYLRTEQTINTLPVQPFIVAVEASGMWEDTGTVVPRTVARFQIDYPADNSVSVVGAG